jgi:hypothetical protein
MTTKQKTESFPILQSLSGLCLQHVLKNFCNLKESKAGKENRISGEVTYPFISDDCNSVQNSSKASESECE